MQVDGWEQDFLEWREYASNINYARQKLELLAWALNNLV